MLLLIKRAVLKNKQERTNKMKDYEIVKNKNKFEVLHIYGKNVYCKTFRTKFMANIHLFFKNLGD